jgi:extensin-like protein
VWSAVLLVVAGGAAADHYPLDGQDRTVAPRGPIRCPAVATEIYRGSLVRYTRPARVHPAFAERLRAFEQVVVEVAREHFGRPPSTLRHAGTFSCRRVGGYPTLLSEHGLGNGIDVVGFSFPRLPARLPVPRGLPPALRRRFEVTLADWRDMPDTPRARFLDALARRLVARPDIFRVLLGPAYPGHKGHFHFDVAPYRLVAIWTTHDEGDAGATPDSR